MKLTKRTLDGLQAKDRRYVVWDDELPRFGVRVEVSGTRTFIVDYHAPDGRRRQQTLGRYGTHTIEQARDLAKQALHAVSTGVDPLQAKQDARAEVTLKDFITKYLADHARPHTKLKTFAMTTDCLTRLVPPRLAGKKLSKVTTEDIDRLRRDLKKTPSLANRTVAAIGHVYTIAQAWKYVPDGFNPTHHVAKYKETARTRVLDAAEFARLGEVLTAMEPQYPHPVRAIRLLLLTGCRMNEILTLRWADVDLPKAVLHLRAAKAGARDVPLGASAIVLLAAASRDGEWVIPGQHIGRHLIDLHTRWSVIRIAAEIPDVRIHDLRHCVGATGAGSGMSLLLIGAVLGHKSIASTQRYSHVGRTPAHDAADRISGEIQAALDGKPLAEVVELRQP